MKIFFTILTYLLVALISYLIGSISFSKIIANHYGVDITKVGSLNAGGTNVGRSVSKKAGIMTMTLDLFKCYIPMLVTFLIFNFWRYPDIYLYDQFKEVICCLSGVCVSLGHVYPIFYKFKGGKAVACFSGFCLFISPILFALAAVFFFSVFSIKKRVSLASILGTIFCFLMSLIPMILDLTVLNKPTDFNGGLYFSIDCMLHLTYVTTIVYTFFLVLIIVKHRSNIKRLINGEEPETKFKKIEKNN